MRVLMLCTKYPLDPNNRYMTNELAGALAAAGHRVQVVVTDWDASAGMETLSTRTGDGVDVLVVAPRAVNSLGAFFKTATKWTLSSLFARREMQSALGNQRFDTLLCFTPCVTVAAQIVWATKHWRTCNLLFVHDFFPYHHHSIGLVPGGPIFALARSFEQWLMRRFHVIGCMSPMNVSYLRAHYQLHEKQLIQVHPIWGQTTPAPTIDRQAARTSYGLPLDRKIVVFGGQITEGRGIENVLAAAAILQTANENIAILIIGRGRLVELVKRHIAEGGNNVIYREHIPRSDYLGLITACDVGLVCTVSNVDVPTFPSKIIDYLRADLPVVAAVEETTDYGRFVEEHRVGIAVPAADPHALAKAIKRISNDKHIANGIRCAARQCLTQAFEVNRAVMRIEDAVATVGPVRT